MQGLQDGFRREGRFRSPQGLALDASINVLYVADTFNDRLRVVDLSNDGVSTLMTTNLPPRSARDAERGAVVEDLERDYKEEGRVSSSGDTVWLCLVRGMGVRSVRYSGRYGVPPHGAPEKAWRGRKVQGPDSCGRCCGLWLQDLLRTPDLGMHRTLRLPCQLAVLYGYVYITAAGANQVREVLGALTRYSQEALEMSHHV
jgi:hypothetical protein